MKQLSICIPTYNRKECLSQCLESIIKQSVFNDIEIIISDNASTDGTFDIIKEYCDKFSNISYFRNSENIWFDRNVLQVIWKATSKYCLLIWDDDAFFEDSLRNILYILRENQANMYLTNNWWYDQSLKNPVTLAPNINILSNQLYPTLNSFIHSLQPKKIQTVGYFWWMSGLIFLREKWLEFKDKEQFIGSQTIHLFVLIDAFKNEPFMLIFLPTIKTRADNIRWDTFGMNSAFKREMVTKSAFLYIAKIHNISYSKTSLMRDFVLSYIKNIAIFWIKKYFLRDQEKILRIKKVLGRFHKKY